MKRSVLVALMATVMVMASAGAALAGEVKGPPGPGGAEGGETPIAGFWTGDGAASICSFSGLNDVINDEEPIKVQSYGQFIKLFGKDNVDNNPEGGPPGVACNPNRGPDPKR